MRESSGARCLRSCEGASCLEDVVAGTEWYKRRKRKASREPYCKVHFTSFWEAGKREDNKDDASATGKQEDKHM